jgi:hypothetical protein
LNNISINSTLQMIWQLWFIHYTVAVRETGRF